MNIVGIPIKIPRTSEYHTYLTVVRLIECNCQCQTNSESPKRVMTNWFARGQRLLGSKSTHGGKQLQIQRRPKLGQSAILMTAGIMTALHQVQELCDDVQIAKSSQLHVVSGGRSTHQASQVEQQARASELPSSCHPPKPIG